MYVYVCIIYYYYIINEELWVVNNIVIKIIWYQFN